MSRPAWTPTDRGLEVTEHVLPEIQHGNADLEASCTWSPRAVPDRVMQLTEFQQADAFGDYSRPAPRTRA